MKTKKKVAVLMGGKTSEYNVSITSGIEVVKNLSKSKYIPVPIIISPDGLTWYKVDAEKILHLDKNPLEEKSNIAISGKKIEIGKLKDCADIFFIAIHGTGGEDGRIQGLLETIGAPYTGSGVMASSVGMAKGIFRKVMASSGIPQPRFIEAKKGSLPNENFVLKEIGEPPYFVKPHNQGSSYGVSIARSMPELVESIKKSWKYSNVAVIDEYIRGKELTCAVLGGKTPRALPVIEIVPSSEFFDYESKYTDTKTKEIVPAKIPDAVTKKVQKLAVEVFKTLGCRGFARIDFILKENGEPVVLEINTVPGLTPSSLFPKAAKAAGISYSELLDKIIEYSI